MADHIKLDRFKLLGILQDVVKSEIDSIVSTLLERFDKEIVPFEDTDDPARKFGRKYKNSK